jgi:hypothetical protein
MLRVSNCFICVDQVLLLVTRHSTDCGARNPERKAVRERLDA